MNIRELENAIGARYAGEYVPGHMGSSIMRFRRGAGDAGLVVKYAELTNATALSDLAANVSGYRALIAAGAASLVPPELRLVDLSLGRALVMQDLGESTRLRNDGIVTWKLAARAFEDIVRTTVVKKSPDYVGEVLSHMRKFVPNGELDRRLKNIGRLCGVSDSALMLLDFTPDNVFVSDGSIRFLDPWEQATYLGHPAVSLGQFAKLAQMYQLRDATEAFGMFKRIAIGRFSTLLGCDEETSAIAFRLGQTLQLVLSAYVRRDNQPTRASELYNEALALWN
jgi:hypothetical protein